MVQSLQNVPALQTFQFHQSQQLPLCSRWHILWHAPTPGLPFVQVKEALQLPVCPCAQVSFQLCRRKLCVLCYRQDLGSLCTLEPRLEMYQWLQVAPHHGHSQTALFQMEKKTHCWCINEFTAGQSAGIYFWNMRSHILVTTCIIIEWITWVPHFSTYATKLELNTD